MTRETSGRSTYTDTSSHAHALTHSTAAAAVFERGFFATSKSRTSVHPLWGSPFGCQMRRVIGTERRGNEGYYANGAMMNFAVKPGPDSLTP